MIGTIPRYVAEIRPYFATSEADMLKIVLNSTSNAEANFAIDVLKDRIPSRSLVTACNLREAIKDLPRCPIAMAVDFEQLERIWEMERVENSLCRSFDDPGGAYDIVLLGQGNLCYDIAIRTQATTVLWLALDPGEDLISHKAMDLVMSHETLLRNVVDLEQAMGLPFNPTFYFSLEDWHLEYAGTIFSELDDLLPKAVDPVRQNVHLPRERDIFDI